MMCTALAKHGGPCPSGALAGSQFCLFHDPDSSALRRESGRKGGTVSGSAKKREQRATVSLRSVDGQLTLIEEMATDVLNSCSDANSRAGAICKLLSLAIELVKTSDIEAENTKLRDFIERHVPEAKKLLRAVK